MTRPFDEFMYCGTLAQPIFPPIEAANEDGLVMLGGRLTPDWLLEAYRRGIFPWPIVDEGIEILAWFSPDPRAIIELDDLHVSRRLGRRMRSGVFRVTMNRAFPQVVQACAAPRPQREFTWITPSMTEAYMRLHAVGHAHSVEVWMDDRLVGGLYGVAIGGMFAGESMFHLVTDASKVALATLVGHLRRRGFQLFDIQQTTGHSLSMGSIELSRAEYARRLAVARDLPVSWEDRDERPATGDEGEDRS